MGIALFVFGLLLFLTPTILFGISDSKDVDVFLSNMDFRKRQILGTSVLAGMFIMLIGAVMILP